MDRYTEPILLTLSNCVKFFHSSLLTEVLGAVVSVLIIWVVTGVLVYEAIKRCIYRDFEIEADVMLITAGAGVFVNIL